MQGGRGYECMWWQGGMKGQTVRFSAGGSSLALHRGDPWSSLHYSADEGTTVTIAASARTKPPAATANDPSIARNPLRLSEAAVTHRHSYRPMVPIALVGMAQRTVAVAAGTPTEVLFRFRCQALGVALLKFEAYQGDAVVDGMEKPLAGMGLQDPILLGTSFAVEAPEEACVRICGTGLLLELAMRQECSTLLPDSQGTMNLHWGRGGSVERPKTGGGGSLGKRGSIDRGHYFH